MSETFQVKAIATVVGGHLTAGDDYQGGVESVIRLNEEYPSKPSRGWRSSPTSRSCGACTWRRPRTSPCMPAAPEATPRGRPPEPSCTATTAAPTSSPSPTPACSAWKAATFTSPGSTRSTELPCWTSPLVPANGPAGKRPRPGMGRRHAHPLLGTRRTPHVSRIPAHPGAPVSTRQRGSGTSWTSGTDRDGTHGQ